MLNAGKVIFLAFFDICRFNKGPQDIPQSKYLTTLCVLVYGLCSMFLVLLSESIDKAVLAAMAELFLILIFTQALLQVNGKASRWSQTVTAMTGTGIIISLLALPVYILIGVGEPEAIEANSLQQIGLLLLAILACWNIVIIAHILKHALETGFFASMLISLAYIYVVYSMTSIILQTEIS